MQALAKFPFQELLFPIFKTGYWFMGNKQGEIKSNRFLITSLKGK